MAISVAIVFGFYKYTYAMMLCCELMINTVSCNYTVKQATMPSSQMRAASTAVFF